MFEKTIGIIEESHYIVGVGGGLGPRVEGVRVPEPPRSHRARGRGEAPGDGVPDARGHRLAPDVNEAGLDLHGGSGTSDGEPSNDRTFA